MVRILGVLDALLYSGVAAVVFAGCSSSDEAPAGPSPGGAGGGVVFLTGGATGSGGSGATSGSDASTGGTVEIGTFTGLTGTHHLLAADAGIRCTADAGGILP